MGTRNAVSAKFARSVVAHLPLLFVCWALALPAAATPLTGASLYSSVQKYASFGEHRTGGTADHQTSEWLASELEDLGFDVERQRFELKQFFPESTQLTIGNRIVPAFPHWFPQIVEQPVVAPLAELPGDSGDNRSLKGRIAYLAPERAGDWHELDVSNLAVQAAKRGAVALVVAVPHPSKAIYARNAAEPFLQSPLPLPTLIVAANAAPLLTQALTAHQPVTFE